VRSASRNTSAVIDVAHHHEVALLGTYQRGTSARVLGGMASRSGIQPITGRR
jgi:hypothetical protein